MLIFKPSLRRFAPALLLLPIIVAALALTAPSCATAKDTAIATGKDCAAEVGPTVLKVVRDASFSTLEADLPAILAGLKECVALDAARAVADELAKIVAQPPKAAATSPSSVPAATAKARLDAWLAAHSHAINFRYWRVIDGRPSPFIPSRANC